MSDLAHVEEIELVMRGDAQSTGRDAVVQESWRRCIESYGLDPTRPDPAHVVTEAELRTHREQTERLIATARSGLQTLFRQVANQNYVLLLANAEGVSVDFFGDMRFEDELRQAGLYLGSKWNEDLAGTSGVGSCLVTGMPVTIHQGDHFGMAHTPLSCTAAPIFDTLGQLTAVLDVSLLRSPSPKSSQNLAMNLVSASARRIELANLMAMTRQDWVLRFSTSPEFLEVDPEAAIALDGSGRITGMTQGARAFLGAVEKPTLIGRKIGDLLEMSVDDLPDLMRGRPAEERILRLRDGRGIFGHAIAPQRARVSNGTLKTKVPAALSGFAGPDPALDNLLQRAARLAPTTVPLLLAGETGTGKERLARALHVCGRPGGALTKICCATAPECGDVPAGTLFLKGVEDLDDTGQAALLALLEARNDLRPIASTKVELARAAEQGGFRPDLYFRLAGETLALPPLRMRHDLNWMIDRLLRRHCADDVRLSPAARAELAGRAWPGNIRELESVLDVAAAMVGTGLIDLHDLPKPRFGAAPAHAPEEALETVLDACGWNMSRAARRLGVNRSTVLRRVRKAGLAPSDQA